MRSPISGFDSPRPQLAQRSGSHAVLPEPAQPPIEYDADEVRIAVPQLDQRKGQAAA